MDGNPDDITFSTSSSESEEYSYVLTNENDEIILVLPISTVNFDGFPEGEFHVWGVSYADELIANENESISSISATGVCAILSDNFVKIITTIPDAGLIETNNGADFITACIGDEMADELILLNNDSNALYNYLLIKEDSIVQSIISTDTIDLENYPGGVYKLYEFAYSGSLNFAEGDTIDLSDTLSTDCYDLSNNFILVESIIVDAGYISDLDGNQTIYACPDNGNSDLYQFQSTDTESENRLYIITDQDQIILEILPSDTFDFDLSGFGTCQVWSVAYTGDFLLEINDLLLDPMLVATGCADISENPIQVVKDIPEIPILRTEDDQEEIIVCPGDGIRDSVFFKSLNDPKGFLQLIITTPDLIIIGLPNSNFIDFENVGPGECWVWAVSHSGELDIYIGGILDPDVSLSNDCHELSENHVVINRQTIDGGEIGIQGSNETEFFTCPEDGNDDWLVLEKSNNNFGDYQYLLVDEFGILLSVFADSINLDSFTGNSCQVYGLAYLGDITANIGDSILTSDIQLASRCASLSENNITIEKIDVDGATIGSSAGDEAFLCLEAGSNPFIVFSTFTTSLATYRLIIVNDEDEVIGLPTSLAVNMTPYVGNACRIYGISFTGQLTISEGDDFDLNNDFSSGCFELSENFIQVNKDLPDGGSISFQDGGVIFNACNGDGEPDYVSFQTTSNSSLKYEFLLADNNLKFLNRIFTDTIDFEIFPPGQCIIAGASYSGEFLLELGDDIFNTEVSDDCFELSENFIIVERIGFEPHQLQTSEGATAVFVCPDSPGENIVEFEFDNPNGTEVLILYGADSIIFHVSETGVVDLDTLSEGICFAQSVWYNGSLRVEVGDTLSADLEISSRCQSYSENVVEIIRAQPNLGLIKNAAGKDSLVVCPDDNPNFVTIESLEDATGNFASIITNTDLVILNISTQDSFDVNNFPLGECLIWGLSYTGNIDVFVGQDITGVSEFSDDCSDLSDNALYVVKEIPEAGAIQTKNGLVSLEICSQDDEDDFISFEGIAVSATEYLFVITTEIGEIIGITIADSLNFNDLGVGICRVYGLAYTGELLITPGQNLLLAGELSDDCYDLSVNFIEINRYISQATEITTVQNDTIHYSCTSSLDTLSINSAGSISNSSQFVVTDVDGIVIAISDTNSFPINDIIAGNYLVFEISSIDNINIEIGDPFDPDALNLENCTHVSSNSIVLIRDDVDGAEIDANGETQTLNICAGFTDSIYIGTNSLSTLPYLYLLLNENNTVLSIVSDPKVAVSDLGQGSFKIFGLSYSGELNIDLGDVISAQALSTKCFERSSNTIDIHVIEPSIDQFNVGGETEISICNNAQQADSLEVSFSSSSALSQVIIIVDQDGIITSISDAKKYVTDDFPNDGTCSMYGFSYDGNIAVEVDDIFDIDMAIQGCYLSTTPILITKGEFNAGIISLEGGQESISICVSDDDQDILSFINSQSSGNNYSYVVTDENNIIRNFSFGSTILFTDDQEGICRVYGLSHESESVSIGIGQNIIDYNFSEQCFEITQNFVEVIKVVDDSPCITSTENLIFRDGLLTGSPNPFSFDILLTNSHSQVLEIEIFGSSGAMIGDLQLQPYETISLGDDWACGIYQIIGRSGQFYQYIRVLKN